MIGLISFGAKQTGERSAGNPPAAFDVASAHTAKRTPGRYLRTNIAWHTHCSSQNINRNGDVEASISLGITAGAQF